MKLTVIFLFIMILAGCNGFRVQSDSLLSEAFSDENVCRDTNIQSKKVTTPDKRTEITCYPDLSGMQVRLNP